MLLILLQMMEINSETCELVADTFIPNLVLFKFGQIPITLYFKCDTVFMIAT
jgi:hypothetical protein